MRTLILFLSLTGLISEIAYSQAQRREPCTSRSYLYQVNYSCNLERQDTSSNIDKISISYKIKSKVCRFDHSTPLPRSQTHFDFALIERSNTPKDVTVTLNSQETIGGSLQFRRAKLVRNPRNGSFSNSTHHDARRYSFCPSFEADNSCLSEIGFEFGYLTFGNGWNWKPGIKGVENSSIPTKRIYDCVGTSNAIQ